MLPLEDSFPLTPLQNGLLFEHHKEQRPGLDVVQILCELHEKIDERCLIRAWNHSIERHSILRTGFRWEYEGVPSQEVHREVSLPIVHEDWRKLSSRKLAAQWEEFLREDRKCGFDLVSPPLMRVTLIRTGWRRWRLCWTFHHLLLDGRAVLLLLNEVFDTYAALKRGEVPTPATESKYRDLIEWYLRADWSAAEKFWRESLQGFHTPTPLQIMKQVASEETDAAWAECQLELPAFATAALKLLAQQSGVTMNTVLQSAWALLLRRYSGEDEVVFGAIRACRKSNVPNAEKMVGLFVNTLPVRARVCDTTTLTDLLQDLRAQWVAMRDYENTPLVNVQGWSGVPRGTRLFETIFNFQEPSWDIALASQGGDWRGRRFSLRSQPGYPLTLDIYGGGAALVLKLNYDPRSFDEPDITQMLGHYKTLLENMGTDGAVSLSSIQMHTPAQRRQMLVEWNHTTTKYPQHSTLHGLFEEQVKRAPQAVAVTFGDEQITYEKLNFRTNRLANYLRSRGVECGTLLGICMERSIDMVVAVLGILKAGGAYVPLDPAYPKERLAFMLRDTATPILLTQERLLEKLPETPAEVICVDRDWQVIRGSSSDVVKSDTTADGLAYVIYTSGSTGMPKGVCVPHRAVVRLVRNTNYITLRPDDRVAQAANASFDAATFEIWGALLNGARIVGITKDDLLSPEKLAGQIRDLGITTLFLTTALFNQLAREIPDAFASLRHLLFGGEAVDPQCVRAVLQSQPPERLLHVYGPTETTTFATWLHVTEVAESAATVSIGRPISNTEAYVLDPSGNLAPVGVSGELLLGGDGVAAGYLNQPELTAEKFVPDPFNAKKGARLYRTGDLVRWTSDGFLEFLGRIDHQVKVRGFRIELGEIEIALLKIPQVREAVVVLREDVVGVRQLAAYFVAKPGMKIQNPRRFLGEHLPSYMVPPFIIEVGALPLTANGKIDRQALPRPGRDRSGPEFIVPQTETEEVVAAVWSDVLKLPLVGSTDHFFGLGGDSLRAMDAIARLRKVLGRDIPIRLLFEKPTVEAFSASLDRLQSGAKAMQTPPITRIPRGTALPLSFYQQRLWHNSVSCMAGSDHHPMCYRLKGPLDASALERSFSVMVARHEILRTTFRVTKGEPAQIINPVAPVHLTVIEMTGSTHDKELVAATLARETKRPFDLERDVMIRATLLRWSPVEHRLLVVIHGMVYDGVLREIFFPELSALYSEFCGGRPNQLPAAALQYADFAVWQRKWMRQDSEGYQRTLAYWRKQLGGELRPLQLSFTQPKPAVQNLKDSRRLVALRHDLAQRLISMSQQREVTLFVTLLASFKVLLHHDTGQTDLLVGTYFANRNHTEMEGVIGPLSNLILLRTDVSGNPTFMKLLDQVRETVLQAHSHQDLPYDELMQALSREGRPLPDVRVIFMLTNVVDPILKLAGLKLARFNPGEIRAMPWGFTLNMLQSGDKLTSGWVYDTDQYEPGAVLRMIDQLNILLEKVVANPCVRIADLAPESLTARGKS